MKYDLEPAKAVIRRFLAEIEAVKKIQESMSQPMLAASFSLKDQMPEFDVNGCMPAPDSYWEKEDAYMWLYAEAKHFRMFMHRPKTTTTPEYFQQPALPVYLQWEDEEKEIIYRGTIIPKPSESQTLADYLQELSLMIVEGNEHRSVWRKSLRCFLEFLRQDTDLAQQGGIEVLFPYRMELRKGMSLQRIGEKIQKVECHHILRRVEDAVYPIDILAASDIIKNLAETFLKGRPNSQHSAGEALAFTWVCHAVGAYRLMTREEIVFSTSITELKAPDPSSEKKIFIEPEYYIGIQSLFGLIDVPISHTLHDFLKALPRDSGNTRIFSMPWRTLLRTFHEKGVQLSKKAQGLGRISFLTFMSPPHEAIGHRAPLKKNIISSQ